MDLIYENVNELFSELKIYLQNQKSEGKKIIAHFGHEFLPHELIESAGAVPLNLIFAGNEDLMQIGADFLNPTTCSYARSLVGMFNEKDENPKYDFLNMIDGIILSNYCTANLLVAESISKNFDIQGIEFFIPYIQKERHIQYYQEQLEYLGKKITKITGSEISNEIILKTIRKYNGFREKLSNLYKFNINGVDQQKIFHKSMLFGPDAITFEELKNYTLKNFEDIEKRVILSGCPVFLGDPLMTIIEDECSGSVIYNDTWVGNLVKYANIDLNQKYDSVYELLTSPLKNNLSSSHSVPNYIQNYTERMINNSKTTKTRSVVNHIIKFCDLIGYPRQFIKEELNKQDFQVLNLERDYSRESKGELITRIEAFLEVIK